MALYEYDAYLSANEPPLVRIARKGPQRDVESVRVLELHLDWTWTLPVELALDDGLWIGVSPHASSYPGTRKRPQFGLVAFGRCSAFVRRWGATTPVDMLDPRVIAGLKAREEMERLAWLMERPIT